MNGDDNWFVRRHNKAPPMIDTFIVSEMPTRLYALFDFGLTIFNSLKFFVNRIVKL